MPCEMARGEIQVQFGNFIGFMRVFIKLNNLP